jgi:hypothetical protein
MEALEAKGARALEHFQENARAREGGGKNPLFGPKMRQGKNAGAVPVFIKSETALENTSG